MVARNERRSMTDAGSYRENAETCAAFADRARSPRDRAAWLLMSSAWLELAVMREYGFCRTPDAMTLAPFREIRRSVPAICADMEPRSKLGADAAA
jgi:hypothetical protein